MENLFPRISVFHLLRYAFDHMPILLDLNSNSGLKSCRRRINRFEQMSLRDEGCAAIINES